MKDHAQEDVTKILLANKADLKNEKVISTEQGLEFAKLNDMAFYETSARTGLGIKEAFESVAGTIIEKKEKKKVSTPLGGPSI